MISGGRNMPRSWSMTAASISAAGTRRDRAGLRPTLQDGLADVVAVEPVAPPGVRRRHRHAGRPEEQALQQCRRLRPGVGRPGAGFLCRMAWTLSQSVRSMIGFVLAGVRRALVHRLAEVDPVVQQLVEVALVDELAAPGAHALGRSSRASRVAEPICTNRSKIDPDGRGLGLVRPPASGPCTS